MTRAAGRSRSTPADPQALAAILEEYAWQSRLPLTVLLFLGPMIVLYEFGTVYFASDWVMSTETRVLAFSLMRQFMSIFGLPSRWMPGLAVIFILLFWHIARGDPWRCRYGTAGAMVLESALLAFPILAWARIQGSILPLYAGEAGEMWRGGIVLSLGAGIYEEAIFRLVAFTLADIILIDLLRIPKRPAYVVIILGSSVLFAAYHHWTPQSMAFAWPDFVFRTVSGVYFGMLFLWRGFGVTAGAHVAYDMYFFVFRAIAMP
jgi:hypothetical protein